MDGDNAYQIKWFAMGTEWQLQIYSSLSETRLQSVAEAVTEEIERIEQQLSFYREDSEICSLNATAALGSIPVDPRLFRFLEEAKSLSEQTSGAFDPTIGPMLRCWGFVGGSGAMPNTREIDAGRTVTGMQHVLLEPESHSVGFDRAGVELEFGAIGKGYAIDRAVGMLRDDFEIQSVLIHGGGSTIYGIGAPPGADAWTVAIQRPSAPPGDTLISLELRDRAVSVSAPHGKWFEQDGKRYGHVLDPRTGYPVAGSVVAVVATGSAMDSDALSTALLVLGEPGIPMIRELRPDSFVLIGAHEGDSGLCVVQKGPVEFR